MFSEVLKSIITLEVINYVKIDCAIDKKYSLLIDFTEINFLVIIK